MSYSAANEYTYTMCTMDIKRSCILFVIGGVQRQVLVHIIELCNLTATFSRVSSSSLVEEKIQPRLVAAPSPLLPLHLPTFRSSLALPCCTERLTNTEYRHRRMMQFGPLELADVTYSLWYRHVDNGEFSNTFRLLRRRFS